MMPKARRRKQITYYQRQRRDKEQAAGLVRCALVIAVVGAGGKSTYIRQQAEKLVLEGKRVAVTTTTHIYNPCVEYGIRESRSGDETEPVAVVKGVAYFGRPQGMDGRSYMSTRGGAPESAQQGWKLGPVSPEAFREICGVYDIVFVEADGSRSMPAKIPLEGEPVLPPATDEVVVVMGRHAVGRLPQSVCQHYNAALFHTICMEGKVQDEGGSAKTAGAACHEEKANQKLADDGMLPEEPLTETQLLHLAEACYIRPLRVRFPWIRSSYYLSDMYRSGAARQVTDVTFILMASGFGRRYSEHENKLLSDLHGHPLYMHALAHMVQSAQQLQEYHVKVGIGVVTRYPEIMQKTADLGEESITYLENHMAEEGITSSIRIGTRKALADHAQLVVFFAADMPYLEGRLITRFVCDCICSGKPYGCMAVRNETERTVTTTVPGAFRLDRGRVADDLLALHGDRGAMRLIRQRPWDAYYFYTEESVLRDIDQKCDDVPFIG